MATKKMLESGKRMRGFKAEAELEEPQSAKDDPADLVGAGSHLVELSAR